MALTLNELYELDNDILRSMVLPFLSDNGKKLVGREWHDEVVRPNILLQCGHFETLHSSPVTFMNELLMWSKMRLSVWTDTLETTIQKYNLTHNYDRTEEWSETRTGTVDDVRTYDGTSESMASGDDYALHSLSRDASVEESVSAYNDSEYSPKDKATTKDVSGGENNSNFNRSDSASSTGRNEARKNSDETVVHRAHVSGNIGITTAQQLIREERELVLFNIVQFIVDDFKQYFCIMVY